MIEERGRVVEVDSAFIWVETIRKDTCGSCEAKNGCGQGLMNRLRPSRDHAYIRAVNRYPVKVGDEVTVALPESAVVSASFLVYLLPLLAMLIGAFTGSAAGMEELWVIGLGLGGLLVGFGVVRWWSSRADVRKRFEPVVLHWHVPLSSSVDT
ncbi:SoxR reducing system RseC family protein [Sansalvadorimonas sp. 2012CJ34-2]|uniref:SoxR reducing system RseC family protein n=1 Tax=Parendozoicomonas callyspongiae TaxID=2942213 RepID=A0ABT0PHF6_9GAMM|nr:SoxR reducing system RseC family protein [Sansalvadorimonas sp. 2012CJ34-2]MCL6270187.1 SoxR reducing system RseC family protein [Sansalvadorimonas sp. 2012CJ34-2]